MKTLPNCLCILGLTAAANAGGMVLMDQVGSNDGADLDGNLAASQIFEAAYSVYSIAALDDFDNSGGAAATSVSAVVGGWNGYVGLDGVQGLSLNFYNTPDEAGASLTGYANAEITGAPTADPDFTGGEMVTVAVNMPLNSGVQHVALLCVNEFATNGQTGAAGSAIGDGQSWQANPGGGFGFGPFQVVAGNFAYRVMGGSGDPCDLPLADAPCNADVDMNNVVNVEDLLAVIGTFGNVGDGSSRPAGDCAPLPNGDCVVNVEDVLAVIAGFGADCTPVEPTGSCCMSNGDCSVYTEAECTAMGGGYLGDDSDCSGCVYGACCAGDGSCTEVLDSDCAGTFVGGTCADAGCTALVGACCLDTVTCLDSLTPNDCELFAGTFAGDGTVCSDSPCGWGGCSDNDTPEGLDCQGDTDDPSQDENGGLNSDPPSYGAIADGETICGTMSTYTCIGCGTDGSDATYRDTDWYLFDNPDGGSYTVTVGGAGALVAGIVDITTSSFVGFVNTAGYEVNSVTVNIGAGNQYAVIVLHDFDAGEAPCGTGQNEYTVSLNRDNAPSAACCANLECLGDYSPADCEILGGTYVGDQSCDTYECPETYADCDTGNGQNPTLSGWWAGTSDTTTGYIRYEDVRDITTISSIRVWGITGVYSGAWTACYDPAMAFDVGLYTDDGTGLPGAAVYEAASIVADQAALDVPFGSWTLRRFDIPVDVTAPGDWLKVASSSGNCWFLWISSSLDGEGGTSLLENNGVFEVADRDLSFCLTP